MLRAYTLPGLCLLGFGVPLACAEPVAICLGSSNEWPPYTYSKFRDGSNPEVMTGAAFDLMQAALTMSGFEYTVKLLPWARVQAEMAKFGKNKLCELTWDASFKPERAENFYFTAPLYRTHLGVFYSKKKYSSPPSTTQINTYDLCGVLGYNYEPYGITRKMEQVNSIQQALGMVAVDHCDLFPSEIEVVNASAAIRSIVLDENVTSVRLPGLTKTFYAVISKTSPRALMLSVQLNQAIIKLQASGEAEKIFLQYQPEGSGLLPEITARPCIKN